ncbi:hypothetical protein E2C01_071765 [Portunus trituberculatus]|uniref:Transmembrane protein n=1 Tax=Portunus trituberculatus TaxID=210409 RepID=A0A5B7I4T2_PORTR|nr:hypothetical protein [Portunus trituberculatus]
MKKHKEGKKEEKKLQDSSLKVKDFVVVVFSWCCGDVMSRRCFSVRPSVVLRWSVVAVLCSCGVGVLVVVEIWC